MYIHTYIHKLCESSHICMFIDIIIRNRAIPSQHRIARSVQQTQVT